MEINFLVMDKSWKIIVEKEWSPCWSQDCRFQHRSELCVILWETTTALANWLCVLKEQSYEVWFTCYVSRNEGTSLFPRALESAEMLSPSRKKQRPWKHLNQLLKILESLECVIFMMCPSYIRVHRRGLFVIVDCRRGWRGFHVSV